MPDTLAAIEALEKLLQLAKAAGSQDLSTAESVEHFPTDCPLCDGEGTVDAETFRNYDNAPNGVQFFFGIGEEHQHAKAYWDAMKPGAITPVIEHALSLLRSQPAEPVVTHMNMDPDASPETKAAVADMVRAAYAYKPASRWTDEQISDLAEQVHASVVKRLRDNGNDGLADLEEQCKYAQTNTYRTAIRWLRDNADRSAPVESEPEPEFVPIGLYVPPGTMVRPVPESPHPLVVQHLQPDTWYTVARIIVDVNSVVYLKEVQHIAFPAEVFQQRQP